MNQAILNTNGFAARAGTLTVYAYHPETGEYLGETTPYISLGTGIPANCTLTAPPQSKSQSSDEGGAFRPVSEAGFVYCFSKNEWVKTENHRGETVFNQKDGAPLEIKQLGPLPEGYTEIKPPAITRPGESIVWTGTAWQLLPPSIEQQALTKYQQGVAQCADMAPQGKTPSDQVQQYYQSLWQMAHPPAPKINARLQLNAVKAGDKAKVLTLPEPPAGLGDPNDPNSGWWI